MKKILLSIGASCLALSSFAQITITAADMPVSGDTLRYSIANIVGTTFNKADSGASKVWDFSTLTPIGQGVDTYKTASAVNITYALTISPTAYGYKVADSFPGLGSVLPVSINNLYTFFNKKSSPSRYVAEGFAAVISSLPTPVNYSDEDEWYYFPLTYGKEDSTTFALKFSLLTLGSLKISGYRKTKVDGWGTIKTPYFTSATNCIRVRSEVHEIDSVIVSGVGVGIPRNTVDYKFLAIGEHYPAMWVTSLLLGSTETVTTIRYRDTKRNITNISEKANTYRSINVYPNPVSKGILNIDVPQSWSNFQLAVYDLQGRVIYSAQNQKQLDMKDISAGKYVIQVLSGEAFGYAIIEN